MWNVKHLLLRKTEVLKTSIFLQRKFEKYTKFEEQKSTSYIRGNVYIGITVFSCLSSKKTVSQISFRLFFWGDKRLLSELLRKLG